MPLKEHLSTIFRHCQSLLDIGFAQNFGKKLLLQGKKAQHSSSQNYLIIPICKSNSVSDENQHVLISDSFGGLLAAFIVASCLWC